MVSTVERPLEPAAGETPEAAGSNERFRVPGLGARFNGAAPPVSRPPPLAGEHTDDILAEAGYDAATISAWRSAGVVA